MVLCEFALELAEKIAKSRLQATLLETTQTLADEIVASAEEWDNEEAS